MPETGPVIVIPYNARWPGLFEEEKGLILGQIGPQVLAIEHVGSTAVPGLASKPTLDILVGIRRLEDAKACVGPLADIGYEYVPEYEAEIPDRRYFHKGPAVARTHHLHMVEFGGAFWTRNLLFRDWLRTHPEDARRYAALKYDLARRYRDDREAYTDAKTEFIEGIVEKARAAPLPTK